MSKSKRQKGKIFKWRNLSPTTKKQSKHSKKIILKPYFDEVNDPNANPFKYVICCGSSTTAKSIFSIKYEYVRKLNIEINVSVMAVFLNTLVKL